MADNIDTLKAQLGTLTTKERAELAHFLLCSLDEEEDDGAEAAWDAVLVRRVEEVQSGKVVGKPAAQVFAERRAKHP